MTLSWRSDELPIGYQWETMHGRLFALFFQNGIIRIYDASITGKMQTSLSLNTNHLDFVIWESVVWSNKNKMLQIFDIDTTELMPQLIKLVKDARQLAMVSVDMERPPWTKLGDDESYIFLGHDQESKDYVLSIDGLIDVAFTAEISEISKILAHGKHGNYVCLGKDMAVQHICLDFLDCPLTREIIKTCSKIKFLCDYLVQNIELLRSELLLPYQTFIAKVSEAYENDLAAALLDVLFTGYVPSELEDWLCNTIGDKNLRKWKHLSSKLYTDLNKIMVLTIVPACERLILCGERLHGIIRGLKLLKFGFEADGSGIDAVEVDEFVELCQEMLELTLKSVRELNIETNLHNVFIEWFNDVVMEAVDEDYKRKETYDYNPLKIEQFISQSLCQSPVLGRCESRFAEQAVRISHQARHTTNIYARKWLKQQITATPVFRLRDPGTDARILDSILTIEGHLLVLHYSESAHSLAVTCYKPSDLPETYHTELLSSKETPGMHVKDAKFFAEKDAILILREPTTLVVINFLLSLNGRVDVTSVSESSISETYAFDSLQVSHSNLVTMCSSTDEKMALYECHVKNH